MERVYKMDKRILNSITGRLSLRAPQEESLLALATAIDAAPEILQKERNIESVLKVLSSEFPTLTDFERDFPSLCFALATGVGKTRLMGAFISYLHLTHGIQNFFVLAPNLTIYDKLIGDFTPNSSKYVFKGIAEFASNSPQIVTGDNYENAKTGDILSPVSINIFNISKINSEVRGGKSPRIKRLRETLGDSYFNYLATLPDLVMLMDESHRYRASAGVRALNELNPLLGLELTATPFTESGKKGPIPFKNVVIDYPLARAMDDGFVKEPAVVTQRNFNAQQYSAEQLERIKLEDGIRVHEATKVELDTHSTNYGVKRVKPFMLVIARDTNHASQLLDLLENQLFDGRYNGKVIQVDSSRSGAAEEEMITRLLAVESVDEPTEIVIHVNMLKEGWDVTNLYTIVPLRAANARTLIEQSIGRGLRLPYGKRTGVGQVDRLSIIAHDRFQEIVDEANDPSNPIRLKQLILETVDDDPEKEVVIVKPRTFVPSPVDHSTEAINREYEFTDEELHISEILSSSDEGEKVTNLVLEELEKYQSKPDLAPTSKELLSKDIQEQVARHVSEQITDEQFSIFDTERVTAIRSIVSAQAKSMVGHTIDIPRIVVAPTGEVTYGYHEFELDFSALNLQPSNRELISQSLQTNEQISISAQPQIKYQRLEDYIVEHLVDKDDISYDEHANLIYKLAAQAIHNFSDIKEYSKDELHNIFFGYGKLIADNIHAQMTRHYWEEASGYEVNITAGFSKLKVAAYTKSKGTPLQNFRETIKDKSKIKQLLFTGFQKCLYEFQKFDSDTERRFSIILDRDSEKWFKPVVGQLQIIYKDGVEQKEYQPDFVAEDDNAIYMVETKARKDLDDPIVRAKAESAIQWCEHATKHSTENDGKPWKYLLIPHDAVTENKDLASF